MAEQEAAWDPQFFDKFFSKGTGDDDDDDSSSSCGSEYDEVIARRLRAATVNNPLDVLGDKTWLKVTTQKSVMTTVPVELSRVKCVVRDRVRLSHCKHGRVLKTTVEEFAADDREAEDWLDAGVMTMRLGEIAVFYSDTLAKEVELESFEEESREKVKENGNRWYAEGDYARAKRRYRACEEYGNLAACHLALGEYMDAYEACNKSLERDPTNVKVWYRRAKVLVHKGAYREALGDLRKGLELDPRNVAMRKLFREAQEKDKEERAKMKKQFSKCFSKLEGFASENRQDEYDQEYVPPSFDACEITCDTTTKCFLDVAIGAEKVGRIVVDLFDRAAPNAVENFKCLCAGKKVARGYKNSTFHRIVKGFCVQAGSEASSSIFGGPFPDENLSTAKHDRPGLVSMVNDGPDSNLTQFFITMAPAPHLDGKNVVFGVVSEGFVEVLERLEDVRTEKHTFRPLTDCRIVDCGILR